MRVIIQRVTRASVLVENNVVGEIGLGLLVLVGIEEADNHYDVEWIANKLSQLRIFSDPNGLMNLSVTDVKGQILLVSQFTLHALTKKGNRPSFIKAARPEQAIPLYQLLINELEKITNKKVEKGIFGANMDVSLVNQGPVTIFIDSKNKE